MKDSIRLTLLLLAGAALSATAAEIVSFKDAAKLKGWDAWDDHKAQAAMTNALQREKRSVTWERLQKVEPGLKTLGRLRTRTSPEIADSNWSVGCETLDRDYGDWNAYKFLLPMLGVKHARFFSGWAKTEQEKGVYDFSWLDVQIRECAAMGVKPWICISYGNPVWGSDFRLGMRVKQVTDSPEALAAWKRYVRALVTRYADVVDEWEVWNEPFDQGREYAELFYETARTVREIQPTGKCYVTAISWNPDPAKNDYVTVMEKLKAENALDLASRFIYHPYTENPDTSYGNGGGQFTWQPALKLREQVKGYSPDYDVMQGESGCPAQLEFAHALHGVEWTEYSQAKWNLRRAMGDAVHAIPSSVFTMIDLQYTFMLQSFGLVRSNALKEFVYRRPAWYAMRNVYSVFDSEVQPVALELAEAGGKELSLATFTRGGRPLVVVWQSDARPGDRLDFDRRDLSGMASVGVLRDQDGLVWADLLTGRVCELNSLADVPVWDSPVILAPLAALDVAE